MTVCLAHLCEDNKTLILIADRQIGIGAIEAQPNVRKILQVHPDWRLMFSGNGIGPVFDMESEIKNELYRKTKNKSTSVKTVLTVFESCYDKVRRRLAEKLYLRSGISFETLYKNRNESEADRNEYEAARNKIAGFALEIDLLGAGFDKNKRGHIFSVRNPGIATRHNIPGFHAIGSGSDGAIYYLYYRNSGFMEPLDRALYYAYDAKYSGELAVGVGDKTDIYIWKSGKSPKRVGQDSRKVLRSIAKELVPGLYSDTSHHERVKKLPECKT